MAIEPRELEQSGRPDSGRRNESRKERRARGGAQGTGTERGVEAPTATATAVAPATRARSWGERHGATVFIIGVFVLLALLVVVKKLAV